MPLKEKFLWIVDMNTDARETAFAKHALAMNATGVCIRTSSKRLPEAIERFHDLGLKVYAWRWPPANATGAQKEASFVAESLIPKGLDGYIVDPESDKAGASNDWNRAVCSPIATQFCSAIIRGASKSFVFGITSGCAYPAANMKPHIPWREFCSGSAALYPQCYWRWTNPETGQRGQRINGGTPQKAIDKAMPSWRAQSLGKPVIPMAGEIDVVTPEEIAEFGKALEAMGVSEGHFYADTGQIPVGNLAALKVL